MPVSSPDRVSSQKMTVEFCSAPGRGDWDAFVASRPLATNYHRWGWKEVIEGAFGWQAFYLAARGSGGIRGILPIIWQKSLLFGSFMTSMPFLNGGGVLADSPEAARALVGGSSCPGFAQRGEISGVAA